MGERAFSALQEDARRQDVTIDALLSRIVLSYASFDRYVDKLHMVKLSRPTLKRVLEASGDDAIIEAGYQAGKDVPKFLILAKDGALTTRTVLDHLKDLAEFGYLFEYSETVHGSRRTVTIGHELGRKGSLFLAHYAQAALEAANNYPAFSVEDNSIVIELRGRIRGK